MDLWAKQQESEKSRAVWQTAELVSIVNRSWA